MAKEGTGGIKIRTTGGSVAINDDRERILKEKKSQLKKCVLLLSVVVLFIYANTLQNGYAYDDLFAIQNNALVKKGVTAIPELFSTSYHYGNNNGIRANELAADNLYRPLSLITFAIEYQFLEYNPTVSHLINILLFAGCVLVFFFFLLSLFKGERLFLALVGALLFALHPIHTEVVANIKSRDELLCFFLGFVSLNIFLKYSRTGSIGIFIVGTLCYLLSLLSKETSIAFVFIIPFIFFLYKNQNRRYSIYISSAGLLTAGVYLLIRFGVLHSLSGEGALGVSFIDNALVDAPSFASRFATEIFILGKYLKLLVVPYPLICDYGYNTIPYVTFSNLWVWVSLITYVILTSLVVFRLLKWPRDPLAFGIAFFLVTIFLFSNIGFLIGAELAERFVFFASAGFCIGIAFVIEQAVSWEGIAKIAGWRKNTKAVIITLPILLVFAGITIARNKEWKDSLTLFQTDSYKSPNNCRLFYFTAMEEIAAANNTGLDPQLQQQMLIDAIANFQKSLAIYSDYGNAQVGLADAFISATQFDSAEVHGKRAVMISPASDFALNTLGCVYMAQQRYPDAIVLFRKALVVNEYNANFPRNIGVCYMLTRQFDSAVQYYRRAIDLDRSNSRTIMFMAIAFHESGKKDSARKYEAFMQKYEPGFSLDKTPPLPYK